MPDVLYVGTVSALVEKKNGWYSVEIAVAGKQYPVKADTKLEPLLKQVREIRDAGLVATFTVSESDSENINPNTGRPYTERRLEKVEPGAQNQTDANASPSGGAQGSGGQSMTKEEWAAKDAAIHKTALIKAAADALKHTIPSDPSDEDLTKFAARVTFLTAPWYRQVIATRDHPQEDDIPF